MHLPRLLLLSASGLAGWLGYLSFTRQAVPGCAAGGGCDSVLASAWAWVGPVLRGWSLRLQIFKFSTTSGIQP